MAEKIKMAVNKSRKIQLYKGRQFMPGEVVNAKLVTTGHGTLIDGFEFAEEIERYVPKAPPKKAATGPVVPKVPFESMREKVEKYISPNVEKPEPTPAKPKKKATKKKAAKKKTTKKKAVK